jgi:glucan phosphorylase
MQVVGAGGVTGGDKLVRMAHLAVIGCKRVNGVAEMHTSILKVTHSMKPLESLYEASMKPR